MLVESAFRPYLNYPEAKRPIRRCKQCGAGTKGSKDYCLDHVADNPYVKALLDKMAEK